MSLKNKREKLNRLVSERNLIGSQIKNKEELISCVQKLVVQQEQARIIIQTVSAHTQNNLKTHINSIVTTALHAVFGKQYWFDCLFLPKRGTTECVLILKDDEGNEFKPIDSCAGGVLDVISFALRCAFWSLKPTRKTLILDEPFKYLSADLMDNAVEMIQMISEKLNLQLIIVSHIKKLIRAGEQTIYVSKEKKISRIET